MKQPNKSYLPFPTLPHEARKSPGTEDMVLAYKGGHGESVHHGEKKLCSMPRKREGVRSTRSPSLWLLGYRH